MDDHCGAPLKPSPVENSQPATQAKIPVGLGYWLGSSTGSLVRCSVGELVYDLVYELGVWLHCCGWVG